MKSNENEKEEWRDIEDYEGLYQVSNLGQVKSLNYNHTGREQILKPYMSKNGYLKVCISNNGKHTNHLVHRLVGNAFLPNPQNLPQINHKREDAKEDNRVENLEWCSAAYNLAYGTRLERIAKANTNGKRSKPVFQFDLSGKLLMIWPSTKEIERQLGYKNNYIGGCCLGKYKQAYGFLWSYNQQIVISLVHGNSKTVYQYDLNGNFIKEWSSATEVERQLGYSQSSICDCCNGRYKQSKGYIWSYVKKN